MATTNIDTSAAGPAEIRVEGMGQSREHSLPDQIAADRYSKAEAAAASNTLAGVRFFRIKRGGAVNLHRGNE